MKFAILDQFDLPRKGKNLGDYVQTIAARQFINDEFIYIDREKLDEYKGDEVKMIMASWFMLYPVHWPPASAIQPLFVSSHFTTKSLQVICNSEQGLLYFKQHAPIGCRDQATADTLNNYGVKAYFSGCLTLTLGRTYKRTHITDEILFIDVMYNYRTWKELLTDMYTVPREVLSKLKHGKLKALKNMLLNTGRRKKMYEKHFDKELLDKGTFISQLYRQKKEDDYMQITHEYLIRLSQAKLVITSRIHCALPCLAMGTPVIFVDSEIDKERISGLKDLFNTITIRPGNKVFNNFNLTGKLRVDKEIVNKTLHVPLMEALEKKCAAFISSAGE